jgi:hypothetical protein
MLTTNFVNNNSSPVQRTVRRRTLISNRYPSKPCCNGWPLLPVENLSPRLLLILSITGQAREVTCKKYADRFSGPNQHLAGLPCSPDSCPQSFQGSRELQVGTLWNSPGSNTETSRLTFKAFVARIFRQPSGVSFAAHWGHMIHLPYILRRFERCPEFRELPTSAYMRFDLNVKPHVPCLSRIQINQLVWTRGEPCASEIEAKA